MATPFEEYSLNKIYKINKDIVKIASFDLGNLPFINLVSKKYKKVFISTGGGNLKEIKASIKVLLKNKVKVILMHCVSRYPTRFNEISLGFISKLKKKFPSCIIGLSDHFNGIISGPIAYTQGARVFEKHVTLNRAWKGTDHSFSLEPEGFRKFVRDIRRTPFMLSNNLDKNIGLEKVFVKLGKSIVASKDIKRGEKISLYNITGKILVKNEILVRDSLYVIGKKIKSKIKKGDILKYSNLK